MRELGFGCRFTWRWLNHLLGAGQQGTYLQLAVLGDEISRLRAV